MIETHPMELYYVAYRYQSGLEMIDGPFGTSLEAHSERNSLARLSIHGQDDLNLVVVVDSKKVVIA